jgi:hypothetical protein
LVTLVVIVSIIATVGIGTALYAIRSDSHNDNSRATPGLLTYRLCDTVIEAPGNIQVLAITQAELVVRTEEVLDPANPAVVVGAAARIDARDGDVVSVERAEPSQAKVAGTEEDIAAFDLALASIRKLPFDPEVAPWPYDQDKQSAAHSAAGPYDEPESGIYANVVFADGDGGGSRGLMVFSCKSRMTIYEDLPPDYANVAVEDRAAFERFAADVAFR